MFITRIKAVAQAIITVGCFAILGGCLLQSCSREMPDIVKTDESSKEDSLSALRDENEAIKIALDGYTHFYLNDNPSSRTQNNLLLPKEVIKISKGNSRSTDINSDSHLLYVVNFANEMGYAVVSALRNGESLLAVSNSGNYNEDLVKQIPGLGLWMENALSYAEANSASSPNSSITPDMPTPGPGGTLLQTKSWNDTTSHILVKAQLGIAWGQGYGNTTNISSSNCEGVYFSNGICGCATLAVAQICAGLKMPAYLYETAPGVGAKYYFDWNSIANHKVTTVSMYNGKPKETKKCEEPNADRYAVHQSVARLCRIIGNYGNARPEGNQTSMRTDSLRYAAKLVFGTTHVSSDWKEFAINL